MQNTTKTNSMISSEVSSWHNLWDKTDAVALHMQKGIDFLDRFSNFVKERAAIEEEYAMKLRNLVKKKRKEEKDERRKEERRKDEDGKKNIEEEECGLYSYIGAFYAILGELDSLAAQHEIVGETMKKSIVPNVAEKSRFLRDARKKQAQNLQSMNIILQEQVENMTKLQKNYAKAFRDAQTAHLKHEKAEKNMEISRIDLERAKNNVHQKNQISEQSKQAYASGLENANHAQHEYYQVKLPNLLEDMRKLDIERIECTRDAMQKSVNAEKSCPSLILQHMGDNMNDTSTLKRNTSNHITDNSVIGAKNSNGKGIPRKHSMRFFGSSSNASKVSNNGLNDAYANLPPQQRCRKIELKLQEMNAHLETLKQSRLGMEKMFLVYRENPKLGNVNDVATQMKVNETEINQINEQMERFKHLLQIAQSELNTPLGGTTATNTNFADGACMRTPSSYNASPSSSPRVPSLNSTIQQGTALNNGKRASYSDESICSETSSTALPHVIGNTGARLTRATINGNYVNANGTKPMLTRQTVGLQNNLMTPLQHIDSGNSTDFYEEYGNDTKNSQNGAKTLVGGDDLPILGTCTAMYPFEGSADGTTIAMREGDEMILLEKDEGDGWTRVRNIQTQVDGFVPTSYLNCRWYPIQ